MKQKSLTWSTFNSFKDISTVMTVLTFVKPSLSMRDLEILSFKNQFDVESISKLKMPPPNTKKTKNSKTK